MTPIEKTLQLRQVINEQLTPLITTDYTYLDLPYYPNIGDNFIWDGTKNFLKQFKHKCIYSAGIETFYPHKLPQNTIIILQGGGNFGDLWIRHQNFRKKIIELHPDNPTIIFPQSTCYNNPSNLAIDEMFFANHPNVTMCARDQVSFEFMQEHFPNNKVLLVPDMAFFVDFQRFCKSKKETGKILFAKRNDQELTNVDYASIIPTSAEIHDWPTFEFISKKYQRANLIDGWLAEHAEKSKIFLKLRDLLKDQFYRVQYIRDGINFLNKYDVVYSTRLHIAIAAACLNKEVIFLDNSYGKNLNLYRTWLTELENISPLSNS